MLITLSEHVFVKIWRLLDAGCCGFNLGVFLSGKATIIIGWMISADVGLPEPIPADHHPFFHSLKIL